MIRVRPWASAAVSAALLLAAGPAPAMPAPVAAPVPFFNTAAATRGHLDTTREAKAVLAVDLALGQEGVLVRAPSAVPLEPGRYRLHALAAATPTNHIIAEAVVLRLAAAGQSKVVERAVSFPRADALSPVALDFTVATSSVVEVEAAWAVGDAKLDLALFPSREEARRSYLATRGNAINQLALKARPEAGLGAAGDGDLAEFGDLLDAGKDRLKALPMTDKALPPYRLMVAGLAIERLCPVAVTEAGTDAPAYEPGAVGHATAVLRNWSDKPATVTVACTVTDEANAGREPVRLSGTVSLAGGETRTHVFGDAFPTAGIARRGRVRVEASMSGLEPSVAESLFVVLPSAKPAVAGKQPKKAFAHYMGCYPAGTGPTRHHLLNLGSELRHESADEAGKRGGRFRNLDLVPYGKGLSAEESADLEIRRALRIGLDGFAVDAWAGGEDAKRTFDTLIRVAEQKDYPFELTICVDPMCGGDLVGTVKDLLSKYGNSPKLARRDGKPLVFGYMSWCHDMGDVASAVGGAGSPGEQKARMDRLRTSPLGWHLMGQAFERAAEQVGQPVFYHACMTYFFHEVDQARIRAGLFAEAAGTLARHVGAVGGFAGAGFGYGDSMAAVAAAVRAGGAEWSGVGGMHQKENIPFEVYMPRGTEWLRGTWENLIRTDASLVQLVTWNDYTENTAIAPAYNTRYTVYDLTGYYLAWWKAGRAPAIDRDRIYLTYAKYPADAQAWPFAIGARPERALEVLTMLTAPGTVRLPGREIEYEAPAGLHVRQFPLAAGPVAAELVRGGVVVRRLESPEPVTERPFREDSALVCCSTEFERHWKEDFGNTPPLLYSEYGDVDGDGLPNWFEMYWFTKERKFEPVAAEDAAGLVEGPERHPVTRWPDMATAGLVDPAADPDRDGRTNLQEYRDRTDPTIPAPPAVQVDGAGLLR